MPVSSGVFRLSSDHHRAHVSRENLKLRNDVAGRRPQLKGTNNSPDLASLAKEGAPHSTSVNPIQIPFTLPDLSFSFEKEFGEIHDLYPQGNVHRPSRTRRPSWTEIRIRSVTHPNSPYVPWSEDQRQCILVSTDTLRDSEKTIPDDAGEWVKVSSTDSTLSIPLGQTSLTRRVLDLVLKCLRSLYSPLHTKPLTQTSVTPDITDDSITTLSSIQSTSLEDWLAERQLRSQTTDTATNAPMSLDEYERSGSWAHRIPSTDVAGPNPDPPPLRSLSRTFSLDCVPSPSPTIISFPYFS